MENINRTIVLNYWTRQINAGKETYRDPLTNEKDFTKMGEDASSYFGVLSENGQTDIEQQIFEWATELIF